MQERKYELIINKGNTYEQTLLTKKDFLIETSKLLREPKKIFMGMGNFLELGDYNNLLDAVLFSDEGVQLEKVLDKNNRKMSEKGNIPYTFFKLGVYYPDFLLKDVPVSCVTAIGKKTRLVPGAENLIKYLKKYDPLILSAIPYEIALEITKRLNLNTENLITTKYKISEDESRKERFSGGIERFISGDRKSIEIERVLIDANFKEDQIVYIGSGEAGIKTFTRFKNSIAFNPIENIMPETGINVYGPSLESILVLFNFDGILDHYLGSAIMEDNFPSLVVFSEVKEKAEQLIKLEKEHYQLQRNKLGQMVEYSGNSFDSVLHEIDVALKGSNVDMDQVRSMINERIIKFARNPKAFVKKVYNIAIERYKAFGAA